MRDANLLHTPHHLLQQYLTTFTQAYSFESYEMSQLSKGNFPPKKAPKKMTQKTGTVLHQLAPILTSVSTLEMFQKNDGYKIEDIGNGAGLKIVRRTGY